MFFPARYTPPPASANRRALFSTPSFGLLLVLLLVLLLGGTGCGLGARFSAHRLVKRGDRAMKKGEIVDAQRLYLEAVAQKPDYARAWRREASVALEAKDYRRAVDLQLEALRLDPNHAVANHRLGFALTRLERYDEAEAAFRRALKLRPDFAASHFGLGVVFERTNRPAEARRSYLRALYFQPDHPAIQEKLRDYPPVG